MKILLSKLMIIGCLVSNKDGNGLQLSTIYKILQLIEMANVVTLQPLA